MRLLIMILSLSLFSAHAANQITTEDRDMIKSLQSQYGTFQKEMNGQTYSLPEHQQRDLQQHMQSMKGRRHTEADNAPHALYFISFTIPDRQLLDATGQAKQFGLTPVVRGLIENDFKKTASRVFNLSKQDKNFGIAIDPFVFQQYGIKAVPAIVINCRSGHDTIYGSLPVDEMLEKIVDKGDCRKEAAALLRGK